MANELYPVFLKANKLQILVVGGGFVGLDSTISQGKKNIDQCSRYTRIM